jgi:hypothetical protein
MCGYPVNSFALCGNGCVNLAIYVVVPFLLFVLFFFGDVQLLRC